MLSTLTRARSSTRFPAVTRLTVQRRRQFRFQNSCIGLSLSTSDAIIPSAAWLSRFCSSSNSFGFIIVQIEASFTLEELPPKLTRRATLGKLLLEA
eukprot:5995275-Pyramimonas_sp.AAC.1